jgi:hypothetical protein
VLSAAGARKVGRLALRAAARRLILPINFVDGSPSAPGTNLCAARDAAVAFEIDDDDPTSGHSSSVIVLGRVSELNTPDERNDAPSAPLFPCYTELLRSFAARLLT